MICIINTAWITPSIGKITSDIEIFEDYGRLIFPADKSISDSLTLKDVGNILTWYSYVSSDRTVEIANYLKEHANSGERPEKNLPLPMRAAASQARVWRHGLEAMES